MLFSCDKKNVISLEYSFLSEEQDHQPIGLIVFSRVR